MRLFYKCLLIILAHSCLITFSYGQHYVTAGAGLTGSPVSSDKLDAFRESYNKTNRLVLIDQLDGFTFATGLRYQIAYRMHGEWCAALLAGYQDLTDSDYADFSDGSSRKLAMTLQTYFFEFELGHNWGSFFTNGLLSVYLGRNIQIKNSYKTSDPDHISSFSGLYKSGSSHSIDAGIAIGVLRNSFFIVLKATYPVYTGGKQNILRNTKQTENLQKFPADYQAYVQNEDYPGVGINLDGFKTIITLSYALKLSSD